MNLIYYINSEVLMNLVLAFCLLCQIRIDNTPSSYEEAILEEDLHPTAILYLSFNLNGGNELILSDGSHWVVDPEDVEICKFWLSPFPITIIQTRSEAFPQALLNTLSHEQVKVIPFLTTE
jgi:hypothetical protein